MSPNRMVFFHDDLSLNVEGETLFDIDPSYLQWIPSNVRVVQWYGDAIGGEVEFRAQNPFGEGLLPNQRITELGEWQGLVDLFYEEKQRRENAIIAQQQAAEAARDYWEELRQIRNTELSLSDWTQLPDVSLTPEKVAEWEVYRQALRDLPNNITDPKPLVLAYYSGEIHPDWPVKPQ